MVKKAKIFEKQQEIIRKPIEKLSDLKNTTVLMLAMIDEDREYTRNELLQRSRLSLPKLKGALYYLIRRLIIKVRREKINKKPYWAAYYHLNPKKMQLILYLMREEGIEFR